MCETVFSPYENGADAFFCSYECASGTGKPIAVSSHHCPCCDFVFWPDSSIFAPYCSRSCWIEAELADEEDLPCCPVCNDSYDPKRVKARYTGFCSWSCWRSSTRTSATSTTTSTTPVLTINMPRLAGLLGQCETPTFDEEDNTGVLTIAPASSMLTG